VYRTATVEQYLADASSAKPAPGGGSVSALAGALGASMGAMAANFTVGKKKFAPVEPLVKELLAKLAEHEAALLALVDDDVVAYTSVSRAYRMPKGTEQQREARAEAIQGALVAAMAVPRRIVQHCADVLDVLRQLVDVANPNLISDVGVSALLARAALEGGILNVEINLASLKDRPLRAAVRGEIEAARRAAGEAADEVLAKVRAAVSGSST